MTNNQGLPRRFPLNNFYLLTLVNALFFMATGAAAPLNSIYLEFLGASYATISLMLTSFVGVILLGSYAWGQLSDRLGMRKLLLVIGLTGAAITSYWFSQAPDVAWAWTARLINSLFLAAFTTLSLAMMGDILEERSHRKSQSKSQGKKRSAGRGRNMGLYRGVGSLAFAAGSFISGRAADAYSLRFSFVLCAAFYGAAALCMLALREVKDREENNGQAIATQEPQSINTSTNPGTTQTTATGHPPPATRHLPLLFLAGVILWTASHSASASMWPNFMKDIGYTNTTIGNLWALAAFFELPFMVATGALSDLTGRTIMLAAGGLGIALTNFAYLSLAHIFPALLGAQVLRGFGFGSYTTNAMTYTAEFGEQRTRGRHSGLFNTAGSAGQLIGSLAGGTLAQARGFEFMFGFCATAAFLSAICFLALRWQTNDARAGAWRTVAER